MLSLLVKRQRLLSSIVVNSKIGFSKNKNSLMSFVTLSKLSKVCVNAFQRDLEIN